MLNNQQTCEYLKRIGFKLPFEPNFEFLKKIHQTHLMAVPFENLDITFGREIVLDSERIYKKIIKENRGGFCYELNSVFCQLLRSLGFDVKMISAQVYDGDTYGAEFAHLALLVSLAGKNILVDVGFGDSFIVPISIDDQISIEKQVSYKIVESHGSYTLLQSFDNKAWTPKYKFTLTPHQLIDFEEMCKYHQTSPKSRFTQKTVCTHTTRLGGRVTLSNNTLITTTEGGRQTEYIDSVKSYTDCLKHEFGLIIHESFNASVWQDWIEEGAEVKDTEIIWNEYYRKLVAFIRSKATEDVVDDLLQDVFIKIHTGIDSLKDDVKLESWVYQITRNTITDYYRSRRTHEELPDEIAQPQPEEEESIRKELSLCLEPMIKALPEKYRKAIQMSEIDNKTQREVAEQEGLSLSGAKSRVQRGRALLKLMLHDCCLLEVNKKNQILSYEGKEQGCKHC